MFCGVKETKGRQQHVEGSPKKDTPIRAMPTTVVTLKALPLAVNVDLKRKARRVGGEPTRLRLVSDFHDPFLLGGFQGETPEGSLGIRDLWGKPLKRNSPMLKGETPPKWV